MESQRLKLPRNVGAPFKDAAAILASIGKSQEYLSSPSRFLIYQRNTDA
jgi:hypothetical protein